MPTPEPPRDPADPPPGFPHSILDDEAPARPASPGHIFRVFNRLALQGFGGVLPIAQRELVERERWLTREQFVAKFNELQERAKANPVAVEVLPSMVRVYDRDAAGRTRMTMLKAAVAVVRGGPDRTKEFKDTAGSVIEYRATDDGFELRSKVMDEVKPVTLKVGGKK